MSFGTAKSRRLQATESGSEFFVEEDNLVSN